MASPETSLDQDIDMSSDDSDESQISRESRKRSTEHHYSEGTPKIIKLDDNKCQTNDENEETDSKIEMHYRKGGLANSLHGNIYQLKLQMLFLKRALHNKYDFRLGTEVEDAHKFDDIVFKYKRPNEAGNYEIRFVQAKHRLKESTKITATDLLTDTDDDYSLQKYFISYSKIKQNPEFNKNEIKDFIIYTNIDFDYSNLRNASIEAESITENDPILKVTKTSKTAKRVKLSVPKDHILYDKLRETTDLHVLANALKQHIVNKITIKMSGIFKHYQYALSKTVLHVKMPCATFRDEFLNGVNLSEDVQNFRNILQLSLKIENSDQFKEMLRQAELPVSNGFAQVIDFHSNPVIDSKCLAITFSKMVIEAQNKQNNVITVKRTRNINKLAFHVLVQDEPENGLVKFGKHFFDETRHLKGNLDNFRTKLKAMFEMHGIDFSTLKQYKFKISKFYTCEETSEGDLIYLKSELPNHLVKDNEIEDFLVKLVFAVNQPNELELGEIIVEEMGESSQFNLLDANLVSNSFQNKMLDWFKQKRPEKDKEGLWLDAESGNGFLVSIEKKVGVLISSGISLAYPDKLAAYGIRFGENKIFEKVKMFLSKENVSDKLLCIITPEKETLLSAINVYSSLEILKKQEEYAQYQKNDSCIFMRLKTLLGVKIQSYIIESFKSLGSCNLLIIDCTYMTSLRNEIIKLCSKLSDILMKTNKKIILIANKQNDIIENFDEDLQSYIATDTDDTNFFDLTDESKSMLLQKQVTFQGRSKKVFLSELINQSDEKARDVINVGIMVKLLKNKEISIGSKPKDLSEIYEYYIHRKFKPVVFSIADIQKYLEGSTPNSDLFVVTGVDSGLHHINIHAFDNAHSAEEKFNELLTTYSKFNIHWLQSDSKKFFWYKSHGSILNLMPYRIQKSHSDVHTTYPYLIEESKLIYDDNIHDKITIISGTAGIGKSTVLTNLSIDMINDPTLWVVRINLNDHSRKLEIKSKRTFKSLGESVDKVIDFLFNDVLVLQDCDKFDKELFINNVKNHGKIAFLIDGFDEICPDDADVVIDLLRSLRKLKARNIIVTTRTNFRHKLENELGVFASILEPFSTGDQIEFLVKFWTKKIESANLNTNKIYIYAKSILKHICKCINDREKEFVSIPLHLMMVAEVFQRNGKAIGVAIDDVNIPKWQGCKEFVESDLNTPLISTGLSLVKLYEHFIERKYLDFYLTGKGITDDSKISVRKGKVDSNEAYATFRTKNGLLALKLLFNEKELKELLSPSDITKLEDVIKKFYDGEHIKGIVDEIIKGKPHFIHRTFAEYFASILIAEKILAAPSDTLKCINNVMLDMSPIFVHSIIDKLEGKHETLRLALGKPLLHFILTDSCSNFLKLLIQSNRTDWQKKLDASGKSPLHYAVIDDHSDIVGKLLKYANDIHTNEILKHGSFKHPEYANSVLVKFINAEDNDGRTALYYAIQQNNLDDAFELLLKGASISLLTDDNINGLINHMIDFKYDDDINISIYENGILGAYANQDNKYRPIQEKLFLRAPDFFNKLYRKDQCRILSYFFVQGRVQVIDTLLATIIDPKERNQILNNDDNGLTPLDRVLEGNNISDENKLEITKYLYKHDGLSRRCSMYSNVNANRAVLLAAARLGHIKTLKYFISLEEVSDFNDIVYEACRFNQLSIVKYMYENHKKHITDWNGNTGLHAACDIGQGVSLKIIKYLIDNGDINAVNNSGETPLCMARNRKTDHVIEYLVSKGAIDNRKDLDHVDVHGSLKLHSAIMANRFELAKSLIRHGANINEKDNNGDSPLHLCVSKLYNRDMVEIVDLLLQYGAIFDIKNNSNRTPYDVTPHKSKDSKVFWLLKFLKKLFNSQHLIEDVNKRWIGTEDGDLENWGPYGLCYPNVWDGNNPMLFILNTRNDHGKTLLHIAAETNNLDALHALLKYNKGYLKRRLMSDVYSLRCRDYHCILACIDFDGNTPMHLAARKGHNKIVSRLLNEGAKFNSTNSNGATPEALATHNNHTYIVNLLEQTKHLFVALENRTADEIENYVSQNIFFNARNQLGQTALHLAVYSNDHIVKLLLDYRVDIKATDDNGNTPLHNAAAADKVNIVMLLIHYGAMYDVKNTAGMTPLDIALGQSRDLLERIDASFKVVQSDEPERLIGTLETYDKDLIAAIVLTRDLKNNTLLHYAALFGHFKIVEFLLENGAMYNAENINEESPLVLMPKDQNVTHLLMTIKKMFENLNNVYEGFKTVNVKIIKNVLDCKRKSLLDIATEIQETEVISFLKDIFADMEV